MFKQYLLLLFILVIIDFLYLKLISPFFNKQIFKIQRSNINLDYLAVILVYLLLSVGLFYFGIIKQNNMINIFFLGIFTYGVFELTNKALLINWEWKTVLIDTLWGGILFFLVLNIFNLIDKNINNNK